MASPINEATALVPRTWLPGGVAVPATDVAQAPYPTRMLVEGAGTEAANATYTATTFDGDIATVFEAPNGFTLARTEVFGTFGWRIRDADGDEGSPATIYIASAGPTSEFSPVGLLFVDVGDGVAPGPTVSLA